MFANMELSEILTLVLGIILITNGLVQIITGRVFEFNAERYTEASLRAYARPIGFSNLAIGVGFVLFQLLKSTELAVGTWKVAVGPVSFAVMIVIGIVLFVKARDLLVRK